MPTPNTADAMKRYRAGKAGFTDKAHLKAKGLIPRADGTKRKSDKYKEDMDRQPQDKDVKKKPGTQPKKYYKTLTKKQKDKRADFFKKQKYRKSDDDDDYKPAPGDAGAKTKKSIHTKNFKKCMAKMPQQMLQAQQLQVQVTIHQQ